MNLNELQTEVEKKLALSTGETIDIKSVEVYEGEIVITFETKTILDGASMTGAVDQVDEDGAFVVAALRDAQEKMKRPFIGLSWFRDKYLPALGTNMNAIQLHDVITALIVKGLIVLDKIPGKLGAARPVSAIRTPDHKPSYEG